ncbi:amidase [Aquabacterium sp. J223]|uniref:amidase n=1 Tax=Aquabacterium sp. J223 TaxID=2898431 RepID=UPI0021AD79D5|nr:amidase [Aquabacterium sp. J223]UUX95940.1 amidase [Aquabacterium sp. J223]
MTPTPTLADGFVHDDPVHLAPTGRGPLDGLRFAVKDVMDVAGTVTGNGHPLWRRTHAPAARHARVIDRLLAAGATLVGKAHTDELTYSLAGQNVHHGMPPNPAAPGRIPGGSSSGSASVVAAGLVDFALGTDTGGSVRVPASYCGLYGLRPTHGAVDMTGLCHLAPRFDTLGWFARDAKLLQAVGTVLLPPAQAPTLQRLRLLDEALDASDPDIARRAIEAATRLPLPQPAGCAARVGPLQPFFEAFRTAQAFEAWATLGPWITEHRPVFGPGVAERFEAARRTTREAFDAAAAEGARLAEAVKALVADGSVLCLPTTPTTAPRVDDDGAHLDRVRQRTLSMTAIAGLAGLPQVSLPLLRGDDGAPAGLSLIGPAGSDAQLLALAAQAGSAG